MSKNSKIKSTGELRDFLCGAINDVSDGTITASQAREITKLSSQINESLYSEVKVAKVKIELKQEVEKFGDLKLGAEI